MSALLIVLPNLIESKTIDLGMPAQFFEHVLGRLYASETDPFGEIAEARAYLVSCRIMSHEAYADVDRPSYPRDHGRAHGAWRDSLDALDLARVARTARLRWGMKA